MVPGVVEFGRQEDFGAWNTRLFDAKADLMLVAVGQGSVDMAVACLESGLDSGRDFIRLALPGTETNGWYGATGVEGKGFPIRGLGKESGMEHGGIADQMKA